MDDLLLTLAGAFVLLIVNFTIKAVLYRVKKGKFTIAGSKREGGAIGFETDYGKFVLSPTKSALFYDGKGGSGMKFAFSEIRRVASHHSDESSWVGEFVFGLDFWDLFKANRDTVQWRMLALEMTGGEQLPVFVAGQYVRREIFLGWWFNLERDILQNIGVLQPIEDRLWEVSHQIETMLRSVGALKANA
jgi:hypothetical protein